MTSGPASSNRRKRIAPTREASGSAAARSDAHSTPSLTRAADSAPSNLRASLGLFLFGVALAIFAGTVLRAPLIDSGRLDLQPSPDAEHYMAGAVSLYRHHEFAVEFAGQRLPPRYPFGYSLLMVPWLAAGVPAELVPFLVNGAVGLALVAGLFAVAWRRNPVAGGLAAVLLASWPAFIFASRSPLSEASGGAVALLAFWALTAFAAGGSLPGGLVGALLMGVAVWFRIASFFFAPFVFLALLARRVPWRTRGREGAALSAALMIGLSPLMWFNMRHFGRPWRTGYSFWVPHWADLGNAFRLDYVRPNVTTWWYDVRIPETALRSAGQYGTDSYLTTALVGLLLVTVIAGLRRRAEVAAAGALGISLLALMFYFFQDARLLFPTFLITIPFVAREAVALLERARERRASSIALATLVGALIVASVIGLPRRRNQLGLERALNVERFEERGSHYHAVQLLNQAAAGHPALVLSTINPSYVSALASVSHVVLPLVRSMQPFREPLLVTRADRDARIEKALSENVPVYLVSTTAAEPARIAAPPPDYVWQPLQSSRGARILQLVRETEFNRNN